MSILAQSIEQPDAPHYSDLECEKRFFARLAATGYSARAVFDIGGSDGRWSAAIRASFPAARFEIFEPLAERRCQYAQALSRTLTQYPGFGVHAVALGDSNAQAKFWAEPEGVGSSLLVGAVPPEQQITVPVRRLDDLVAELKLPQPQIIKADVQAGEMRVINGARRTIAGADVLVLETWLSRCYGPDTPLLPEVMDTLAPLGFVMVQLGDFWRQSSHQIGAIDAFFVNQRLINALTARGVIMPWPNCWNSVLEPYPS
jgi:FkbM family methyltransferase